MVPFETLAELFTLAAQSRDFFPVAPPTSQSIEAIQRELQLTLPSDYVQLARACPSYGAWLAGIGDDYEHQHHILRLNRDFHDPTVLTEIGSPVQPALPGHTVMINHGHDLDCDCWDTRELTPSGEHPIVYVGLQGIRPGCIARFESFRAYIEEFALTESCRNPNKAQRRRAKHIVQDLAANQPAT